MTEHTARLTRAHIALHGLSVGDALGEEFFLPPGTFVNRLQNRRPPSPPWYFTDDTNMALSVYSILRQCAGIDQDRLARSFGEHYDPGRGYGPAMHGVLAAYRQGAHWPEVAPSLFGGTGSFGNGAAMRIAPVAGYFADDLEACIEHARRTTVVTHAHPEAVAGGIAAAVAGAIAWQARQADEHPMRAEFIERVLPHVPESLVRQNIQKAIKLDDTTNVYDVIRALGNGSSITCQDTIGWTLWCAGTHLDNYTEALWYTISGQGDIDTTCAIVGGIVALYTGLDGIPIEWKEAREPLPRWMHDEQTAP